MSVIPGNDTLKYQLKNLRACWGDSIKASVHVARSIALAIRQKQQEGEQIVLGLATGSSPIGVYKELVRMHKEEQLSFAHPDDDVISMEGTFLRLVEQGHEVHVPYQTSGNIAVHDHDANRFIEFLQEFGEHASIFQESQQKNKITIF